MDKDHSHELFRHARYYLKEGRYLQIYIHKIAPNSDHYISCVVMEPPIPHFSPFGVLSLFPLVQLFIPLMTLQANVDGTSLLAR